MDETKLLKLAQFIKTLKDELICPICLDIVQDCIEFHCGHRLCSDCYLKCRSSKLTCPVCKTVMKRRSSLYKDEFINNIGVFVSSLVKKFEDEYNCKVEEIIHKCNKTKELEAPKQRNATPCGSTDEKNTKTTTKQRSTPPCESTDEKNKKPTGTVNNNTFDKLLPSVSQSSLQVNKGGQKRVYSNRKKKRKEESIEDFELLDFENDQNKNAVIQWLSDTRNKFDILTQTQNCLEDVSLEPDILPSVSQRKTLDDFIKPLKIIKKGRSRSADEKMKKRTYSSRCSERMDDYYIEDVNTEEEKLIEKAEENVLLNLIEDEFLDNLETQFMKPAKGKRSRKDTDNQSKASLSSTSNTGWERVTEMKKSLKKKQPKKLKVLVEVGSHCPNIKKDKDDSKPKSRVEVEKVVGSAERDLRGENKENIRNGQLSSKITIESHGTEKAALENIEIVDKEPDEPVNNSIPQVAIESSVVEKIDVLKENTCDKIKLITENEENITLNKNEIYNSKPLVDADNDFDPYMVATQKLSDHKNEIYNKTVNKSDDAEFFQPTQKLNLNITDMSEDSSLSENSKDYQENISSQIDLLDFLESSVHSCLKVIDNKCFKEIKKRLHLISLCVTKMKKNYKTTTNISVQTNLNVTNQLTQTSLNVTNRLVQTSVNVTDNTVQTSLNVTDQSVQTAKCDTRHTAAQTDIEIIDRGIQTTLTENSYSQNNSESFLPDRKSSLKVNLAVSITQDTKKALESFWGESDIPLPNTSKEIRNESSQVADVPAALKAATQNEVFTPSMDNLDFETQDLAGKLLENKKFGDKMQNSKLKTQQPMENNDEKLSLPASKESHLECSISSGDKKVNRKLSFISKDNKTKRDRISSDSDSDDEIRPRKKKPRIINSDISVEFESNTERNHGQKSDQGSSESDQINYDECLNEILKNYDDDKGKNDMKKQSEEFPDNKTGETANNFLRECDKIIAEVNKNVENLTKKNYSTSQRNKSSQKSILMQNPNSLDDMNITCGQKNSPRNLVGKFSSEFSDVIGETEDVEPIPKKAKTSKPDERFNRSSNSKMKKTSQPDPEVCDEFNDSFDEAELEKIDNLETKEEQTDRTCVSPKVKIIQNIVLEDKNNPERNNFNNEDDLFSDEDVVETTPQKKNISGDWEPEVGVIDLLTPKVISESLSQHIEDFDLDMALPPPPGFQDNFDHIEHDNEPSCSPKDVTIIELPPTKPDDLLSLTPEDLSLYIKKEIPQKFDRSIANKSVKELNEETPKKPISKSRARFSHSTPSSQIIHNTETLGFSPIRPDDNIFEEEVKNSAKMPLTRLSKPNMSRHYLMTSTPKQKSILNYVRPSQTGDTENILSPSSPKSTPCIACTRLNSSQISLISQMVDKKLATFSSSFSPDVTHMIVAVDDNNCLKDYTVKFVAAVAAGRWVLRFEWVQECLNHNCIIPEASFEVLDDSGGCGPRTARLTRKENPLFRGFKFYCPNQFISTTREEIEDILRTLGGKIVSKPEYLRERDGKIGLIITEGRATQDFDVYEKWLESFKIATVDIEWLSKSVGRYKILSIRPYVWCTDDNLGDYGYPDYLIENVPFTASEQI